MRALRFRSKIDWWIVAVSGTGALITIGVAAAIMVAAPTAAWVLLMLLAIAVGLLVLWSLASTVYVVIDGELLIRSGPFSWRVPLREIRKVTPTRSPLSSPALSLDRLRIDYGQRRWIMVSPRDQGAFIEALQIKRP